MFDSLLNPLFFSFCEILSITGYLVRGMSLLNMRARVRNLIRFSYTEACRARRILMRKLYGYPSSLAQFDACDHCAKF